MRKEFAERALNVAQVHGASYADVRIVGREKQAIAVKNGQVGELTLDEDRGFGVRVVADGAWGFASSSLLTLAEVERGAAQAVTIARASALVKASDVNLGVSEVHVGSYRTPATASSRLTSSATAGQPRILAAALTPAAGAGGRLQRGYRLVPTRGEGRGGQGHLQPGTRGGAGGLGRLHHARTGDGAGQFTGPLCLSPEHGRRPQHSDHGG